MIDLLLIFLVPVGIAVLLLGLLAIVAVVRMGDADDLRH